MKDRRTEVIAALEKMLAHQRWHDVQILGLHVARIKWPELQATESRSDGGEDGTSFAASDDGKKRVLACSATATLAKIRADASRLRERGVKPDVLVFFTPQPVVHTMAEEWRKAVRAEFGHDLHLIGRAEILQTLENPIHDWISRGSLELDFSELPDLVREEARARQAAAAVLDGFKRFYGYDAAHQVDLTLLRHGPAGSARGAEPVPLNRVLGDLAGRRAIVLTGLPGAGKTITLLRLAELLLADPACPIPIVISIPGWLAGGGTLLNCVCETLAPYGLPADSVRQLMAQGIFALLLNGWNETPEGGATKASALIRDFVSKFPGASLALSTRKTRTPQPIAGELQLEVQPLSEEQKLQLIRGRSLQHPDRFLRSLRANPNLARLTDTPLFLTAAMRLSERSDPIPANRSALLASLVLDLELSPEHRTALESGPCQGHHRRFIEDLAAAMTSAVGTVLRRDAILREIVKIGSSLKSEGLCSVTPDAIGVLDSLVQHHFLVVAPGPTEVFGFSHQQVQEWFSAQALARRVEALAQHPDDAGLRQLAAQVLDQPRWHEPLRLMIDDLATAGKAQAAADVIRWTLPVDLILAAELAGTADVDTWKIVQEFLPNLLREWYACPLAAARECALAAMLATARPDFAETIWSLIEDPDDHRAFLPFRGAFRLGTSSLGTDLLQRFSRLPTGRQSLVIRELCRYGGASEAAFARHVAETTSNPTVKLAALESLMFMGERQTAAEIVAAQREPWIEGIYRRVLAYFPDPEAEQFRDRARREFAEASEPSLRRAVLGFLGRLGEPGWLDLAKKGIAEALSIRSSRTLGEILRPGSVDPSLHLINEYVILIRRGDVSWIQNWAVEYIGADLIWERPFVDLIPDLSESLQLRLLALLAQRLDLPGQRSRLSLLAATGSPAVLAELLHLFLHAKRSGPASEENAYAIKLALAEVPVGPLTEAITVVASGVSDRPLLDALLEIIGPHSALDFRLRSGTTPEQRGALRAIAHRVATQLTDPIEHRSARAHLSVLLGSIGDASDVALIATWINEESKLWLELRREWAQARSHRPYRPQARRDITSWWSWYVGALVGLQCSEAEQTLFELLGSRLTLTDAAGALVQYSIFEGSIPSEPGYHPGAWAEIPPQGRLDSPPTSPVIQARAEAIHAAILRARAEPEGDIPIYIDLLTAISALGHLGDPRALPLMIEASQGAESTGGLVRLCYSLTIRGARFPAAKALQMVEPFITKHEPPVYGGGDQWHMVCRALAVLLFSDEPAVGIDRIRRLPSERMRSHDVQEIFAILSRCPASAVADFLLEQSASSDTPVQTEVLNALAAHPDPRCHSRFADIVAAPAAARRHQGGYELQHHALQLAQKDSGFRDDLVRGLSANARGSLSGLQISLLVEIGTPEAVLALVTKGAVDPATIERALQEAVLEKIPIGSGSSYHLVPRPSAELKGRIFAYYISDTSIRADAYAALVTFRRLRAEHGLPAEEPLHPDINRLAELERPWPLVFSEVESPR